MARRGPGDGQTSDVVRQAANVAGALFQIVAAAIAGPAVGRVADDYATYATPAGYAFAIWSPIFALSLLYAVYAAFPARREDPLLRRIGWFTAAAFLLNGLWEILFPARLLVAAQVVLLGVFLTSGAAYLIVQRQISDTRANVAPSGALLVAPTVGLLFGWVTAAALVGFASTLAGLGVLDGGLFEAALGSLLLFLGGLVASGVLLTGGIGPRLGYLAYAAAFLWALVAVMVGRYGDSVLTTGAAAVTAVCVILVLISVTRETRRKTRRPGTVR
ncbi:hypothetical protein [Rubrobacter aplysinae]|uniref:hypothetical protein n=1 Tax=Rubrobacter aplysinae TaxID=909625 RepID=UPI00064BA74D|nr:hypothetical protein [Rubrobacter aplysinae]